MNVVVCKMQKDEKSRLSRRIEQMVKNGEKMITFTLNNYMDSSYYDVIYTAIRNANLPWRRNERVSHFKFGKTDGRYYIRRT